MNLTLDLQHLSKAYGSNYDDFALARYLPIPTGMSRDNFMTLLFAESAGLETVYTDPNALNAYLTAYGKSRLSAWQKMQDALNAEYEALENYDRTETTTDTNTANTTFQNRATNESNASDTGNTHYRTQDTTITNTQGDSENPDIATAYARAYDSTDMIDGSKTETVAGKHKSSTTTENKDDTTTEGTSNASALSESNGTQNTDTENVRTSHIHGNIGVTTSQQMLESEINLRMKFDNLLEMIVAEYIGKACIMVW